MIRVLIVDDHGIVRDGLERLLNAADGITVAGAASSGEEAIRASQTLRPDVILMDLEMPGPIDGIGASRAIVSEQPEAKILILTSFSDHDRILRSLGSGALGYLLKDAAAEDLIRAVRATARGEAPVDPKAARELIEIARRPHPAAALSQREREVLILVGHALPNREIARRLEITERTVKGHLTSIFREIGVADRTQAALWARRHLPDAFS